MPHGFPVASSLVNAPRKTWRRRGPLPDHYAVLGLRPDADAARIKSAYRRLVKRFHPDVSTADATAEHRIRAINDAYQLLADPAARAEYDLEMRRRRAAAGARFWRSFAAGVVTFFVTVASGALVALLVLAPPARELSEQIAPPHLAGPPDQPESEARQQRLASAEPAPEVPVQRAASLTIQAPAQTVPGEALQPGGPGDILAQQALAAEQEAHAPATRLALRDGRSASSDKPAPPRDDEPTAEPRPAGVGPEGVERAAREAPEQAMRPEPAAESPDGANIASGQRVPERASAAAAAPRAKAANWTAYHNPRFGFALRYPADVFRGTTGEARGSDDVFLSSEAGRAVLWISANRSRAGRSITQYRQSLMAERYAGATFDYAPQRENWFVLSGTIGSEMFYQRVTFACDGQSVHHWLLVYPVAERVFFDAIVEEMHRSYRYDLNQRTHCARRPVGLARGRTLPAPGQEDAEPAATE